MAQGVPRIQRKVHLSSLFTTLIWVPPSSIFEKPLNSKITIRKNRENPNSVVSEFEHKTLQQPA